MSAIDSGAFRTDMNDASSEFTVFYDAHFAQLVGSLVLYTGDRELASDLAQETMARAFRDWRKVTHLDAPTAWLHRVAFNLAKSVFRRKLVELRSAARLRRRALEFHEDADLGDAVALRNAVAVLPPRQKTALVLRYYADLPIATVADVMGCAEGTVRALTSQALSSLKRSGLVSDVEEEA